MTWRSRMVTQMNFAVEMKPLLDIIDSQYADLDQETIAAYNCLGGCYAVPDVTDLENRISILTEMEASIKSEWRVGGVNAIRLWLSDNHDCLAKYSSLLIVAEDDEETIKWLGDVMHSLMSQVLKTLEVPCQTL